MKCCICRRSSIKGEIEFPCYQSKRSRETYGNSAYMCMRCAYGIIGAGLRTSLDPEPPGPTIMRGPYR